MSDDFPNRPDHDDFRLMAEVVRGLDSAADDGTSFDQLITPLIDPESLAYMASQRGLRAYTMLSVGGQVHLSAAWLDGFVAGALYQKTKTKRSES